MCLGIFWDRFCLSLQSDLRPQQAISLDNSYGRDLFLVYPYFKCAALWHTLMSLINCWTGHLGQAKTWFSLWTINTDVPWYWRMLEPSVLHWIPPSFNIGTQEITHIMNCLLIVSKVCSYYELFKRSHPEYCLLHYLKHKFFNSFLFGFIDVLVILNK